jgi:hypothetical protein
VRSPVQMSRPPQIRHGLHSTTTSSRERTAFDEARGSRNIHSYGVAAIDPKTLNYVEPYSKFTNSHNYDGKKNLKID